MMKILVIGASLAYLTGSALIVYGIFLLTGLAGGVIASGIAFTLIGYLLSRGVNVSG